MLFRSTQVGQANFTEVTQLGERGKVNLTVTGDHRVVRVTQW